MADRDRIAEIADRLRALAQRLSGPDLEAVLIAETRDLSPEERSAVLGLSEQRIVRDIEHAEANAVDLDLLSRVVSTDLLACLSEGQETLCEAVAAADPQLLLAGIAQLIRDDPNRAENALFAAILLNPRASVEPAVQALRDEWEQRRLGDGA